MDLDCDKEGGIHMLDALTVAKYIIGKCTADQCPISNLQLQKILYYVQLHYLQKTGQPLFGDEIEAWQFGPVVRAVYDRYCGFGSLPLKLDYTVFLGIDTREIDRIIVEKRSKKPWDLVEETHAPGKAWSRIYRDGIGNKTVIPKDVIKNHG